VTRLLVVVRVLAVMVSLAVLSGVGAAWLLR
jgi:hypothetical protein